MNKDSALRKETQKMVLLVCGDPKTGKKSIVNSWMKGTSPIEENKSFYTVFSFTHIEKIDDTDIEIPCEIRILNSDEIETELKINSAFFKGALGAFVTTSITDESSFQDGEKWKEKLDLMCCLPNKFPLPIFLVITKCDDVDLSKPEKQFQEKESIDRYALENQFFSHHYVSNGKEEIQNEMNEEDIKRSAITPFKDMIKVIFNFKDLKEKFVGGKGKKESDMETRIIMDKGKEKNCVMF